MSNGPTKISTVRSPGKDHTYGKFAAAGNLFICVDAERRKKEKERVIDAARPRTCPTFSPYNYRPPLDIKSQQNWGDFTDLE